MSRQLLKDISELIEANIISKETGDNITRYYLKKQQSEPNRFTIILSILGAFLIGGGIILVVAHNWDDLSRLTRTVLSFLPLLLAQAACAYTLVKQKDNATWRECSSVLLFFAVAASISLVSQIYQVNGSLSGYLLTWALLSLPLAYLFSSSLVALLCLVNITWYACLLAFDERPERIPYMYVVVLLALIPHYYNLLKTKPGSNFLHLLNWSFVISVTIAISTFTIYFEGADEWMFLLYCILFCIWYFIGRSSFFEGKRLSLNPFLVTGIIGILSILTIWSFKSLWSRLGNLRMPAHFLNDPLPYLLVTGIITLTVLAWKNFNRQQVKTFDPAGFSFAVFLLLLLLLRNVPLVSMFIVNAWIITIAIYFIKKGSGRDHLGILNFGLIIIASLAICRFFDDTIPFIWRAIFFLAAGSGFFIANYLMIQKRKQLKKTGQ